MTHLIPADYHGYAIQLIEKDGQRWLTARDLGLCLDEFTEKDSCEIKLISQGQERNTRIFSPSGCHLLSFFANTGRAKDFRAWAKEVLVQAGARKFPPTPCLRRLFVHNARRGVRTSTKGGKLPTTDWRFFCTCAQAPDYVGRAENTRPRKGKLSRPSFCGFLTSRRPMRRIQIWTLLNG